MGGVGVACQCAFVLYGAEAIIIDVLVHCSPREPPKARQDDR